MVSGSHFSDRGAADRGGESVADLVDRALGGDSQAWRGLVARLERVVWKSVNMMTADREIRDDAFAATWLRLAERLDTIREPEKLPGWLTTTATNEVRQIVRSRHRTDLSLNEPRGDDGSVERIDAIFTDVGDHAAPMIADETAADLRTAFRRLDGRCRQVLTVLIATDPPMSYEEASALLGRPVGSLGPTRQRCLDKLRILFTNQGGQHHER